MSRRILRALERGLRLGVLFIWIIAGLQLSFLLKQAGRFLELSSDQVVAAGMQSQRTMIYAQRALQAVEAVAKQAASAADNIAGAAGRLRDALPGERQNFWRWLFGRNQSTDPAEGGRMTFDPHALDPPGRSDK